MSTESSQGTDMDLVMKPLEMGTTTCPTGIVAECGLPKGPPALHALNTHSKRWGVVLQFFKKTKNLVFSIKQALVSRILPSGPSTPVPAGRTPF